jgi:hypothetical protein
MVLSGLMYARMSGNTQAAHRSQGGHSLRTFNLTRDLLLLGSLLALLLRMGAGAG